jgi:mono/diheme cytochrome c family protein
MRYIKLILHIFLLVLISHAALANGDSDQEINTEFYRVLDGKVDPATFIGWNVFHHVCVSCHGVGAVGSDVAPDLTESVNRLSPEQFRIKVLHSTIVRFTGDDWRNMEQAMLEEIMKQELRDKGELANMPRWEYNPTVKGNIHNIYRYLKARADGVIGEDRPGILK